MRKLRPNFYVMSMVWRYGDVSGTISTAARVGVSENGRWSGNILMYIVLFIIVIVNLQMT